MKYLALIFSLAASAMAAVEIDFVDGRKETFQSVAVRSGKLRCQSAHGVIEIPPAVLGPKAKAKFFPQLVEPAAAEPNPPPMQEEKAPPPPATPEPPSETPSQPSEAEEPATAPAAGKSEFVKFEGRIPRPRNAQFALPYPLEDAEFFVHIPATYDGSEPWGLISFIHADDRMELPPGWGEVLARHKLLFVAPQKAGNTQPHRGNLGIAGALAMMRDYKIDPTRVYVSGFSGGARWATHLGYQASDLFTGVIAICGADFHKMVPRKEATKSDEYGYVSVSTKEQRDAKRAVRFAIITGESDWRRGNILDVFHGGYEAEKFQARLWDVPGMRHEICGPQPLEEAIAFLESKD